MTEAHEIEAVLDALTDAVALVLLTSGARPGPPM
jgi:hypothetical protein